MFTEMTLNAVSYDSFTGEPLVIIKDEDQIYSYLVTGFGNYDVKFLMSEFSGTIADSSSPYSIITNLIGNLGAKLVRLEIFSDQDVAMGRIYLDNDGYAVVQNCRPLDLVILSNKLSMPIYVEDSLLNRVQTIVKQEDNPDTWLYENKKTPTDDHCSEENELLM